MAGWLSQSLTRPKSRHQQSLYGGSGEESGFKLCSLLTESGFLCCRTKISISCQPLTRSHPQLLETSLWSLLMVPPSQSQQQLVRLFPHSESLQISLLFIFLLPSSSSSSWRQLSAFKGSHDQIGPTQIIQNNLPMFRLLTLITSAKPLLLCIQFPRIRLWTSCGEWGGSEGGIILPTTPRNQGFFRSGNAVVIMI